MGQGMQGPKILRLHSQRLARATLGHYVLANLFHREGMSRQKVRVTGRLGAPMTGYSRAHFGLMSFVTRPKKAQLCVDAKPANPMATRPGFAPRRPHEQKNPAQSRHARLLGANAPWVCQAEPPPAADVPVPSGERRAYLRS